MMKILVCLPLLTLYAGCVYGIATGNPVSRLVTETLSLITAHRTLLIGNGTLRISIPDPQNHPLCIEEIFQGIETLKNQTAEENVVEKIFQNLSSLKGYITAKEKQCGGERRRVEQFLDYLEEFLRTINIEWNTEWTVES
ncbi:interleukin-5 isoform X2 [Notamacropus eugenii]|uniref:Interleukin-5 n=1 Tax=Notamacropus eugenii TaxID=9315 RepID=IL5_NOTEU|nr:RecName: Full=Interleukin-5; Short=IL-5; AltName: Full=Eosinophil differentiation factor; AltName: Full=T-cell replacing factor; Short=TRF; Flags: Precursor [Notamacropus eugenii]AAD37462.1 interleukin-5 [Notamacropus eugenii]